MHKRGGDILKAPHPSPVATNSPSGGKDRCSVGEGEGAGGEKALKCPLLAMSSWPTTGVGKIRGLTTDSKKKGQIIIKH